MPGSGDGLICILKPDAVSLDLEIAEVNGTVETAKAALRDARSQGKVDALNDATHATAKESLESATNRLKQLVAIRDHIQIVTPERQIDVVKIGSQVTVRDAGSDKTLTYIIGGHRLYQKNYPIPACSCITSRAEAVLGLRVGQVGQVLFNGNYIDTEVVAIGFPELIPSTA